MNELNCDGMVNELIAYDDGRMIQFLLQVPAPGEKIDEKTVYKTQLEDFQQKFLTDPRTS